VIPLLIIDLISLSPVLAFVGWAIYDVTKHRKDV
jgi:hypothetical protein